MTTRAHRFAAQGETPSSIDSGRAGTLQTIFAHNPSEAAGAYVKIYAGESAPVGGSVPMWSAWVPPGSVDSGGAERVLPCFLDGGRFWIAVATEPGAGLTAPDADFEISATFERFVR